MDVYDYTIEITIVVIVFIVFMIRLLGAWMLRIDEVIKLLKEILKELQNTKTDLKS